MHRQSSQAIPLIIVGILAGVALAIFIWSDVISVGPLKMELISHKYSKGELAGYIDIDNDSISEYFVLKSYPGGFPVVEVYKEREQLIEVIRPRGAWFSSSPSFYFGDYDGDGFEEIYLFSQSNDSILLNGYELLGEEGHFIKDFYIDECGQIEGKRDLLLSSVLFSDSEGDGFNEMIFIIKAGFSLSPRRIYKYDIKNSVLLKGENCAAGFSKFFPFDLTGDGEMEFIASASAYNNFDINDTSILYTDHKGWVLGYENDLQSVRFAIEFPDNKANISTCVKKMGDEEYIIVKNYEIETNEMSLLKYDLSGKLLQEELMNQVQNVGMINDGIVEMDKLGFSDGNNLYIYNDNLKLIDVKKSLGKPDTSRPVFRFVVTTGYLVFYGGGEVMLFNRKFEEMGRVKVPGIQTHSRLISSVVSMDADHSFLMALTNNDYGEYLIQVEERTFAHATILINILLFIGFYLFFYLVFRLQYFFYTIKLNSEQKIQSLQLQTVQNQLQPHFTFNVLNTIGSLIYKNEKETAYEYLNYFSDMLRSVLISRKGSDWMIDEEIAFIKTYVAMENLRFDGRFVFSLDVSPGTDISGHIPRLMVQTFVENAISHGLMHKKDDCRLSVNIEGDNTYIIVTVEDNGIGRFASGKLQRNNVGHGNDILDNYVEVYNKINKTKFNFTITDLYTNNGKSEGTRVTLWIPRDYSLNTRSQ